MNSRPRMFGAGSSFGFAGCGRYRALEYEPVTPPAFMIRLMRRRDMTMRSCSRTALIFPAPYVLLQCLFDRFGSVFPQCGLMVFPGVVIVSR